MGIRTSGTASYCVKVLCTHPLRPPSGSLSLVTTDADTFVDMAVPAGRSFAQWTVARPGLLVLFPS